MTAGQIAARFEIPKGSLSYHFNVLKAAGLIRCEAAGRDEGALDVSNGGDPPRVSPSRVTSLADQAAPIRNP